MEKTDAQKLLVQIDRFLKRHRMYETDFGKRCMNDFAFVHKLRKGRDLKSSTVMRVRKWMAEQNKPHPKQRAVARVA